MAIDTIDPFRDFLNEFNQQQKLLEESLNEWDILLESSLAMVKGLEETCNCIEAKPPILFLKDVFACGHGLSFLISLRFTILKEAAQLTQDRMTKRYH